MWVPSVFTQSASSTPWTWTFVPVNDAPDASGTMPVDVDDIADVEDIVVVATVVVPITSNLSPSGGSATPPIQEPVNDSCWALFALAAMNASS